MNLTHIRAIYTPDNQPDAAETGQDVAKSESVDIVAFNEDGSRAIFIDHNGNLRSGWLRKFSNCVFVTP